jgi:predicted ester cyclase
MKSLPLVAAAIFAVLPTLAVAESCGTPGKPAADIALVKGFYASLNTMEKARLDDVLVADWIDTPLAPGQGPGREGMKKAMDGYHEAFPDFHVENRDFVVAGDKVVVRSLISATQKGDFAGVKATGKRFQMMAIDIHRLCNGRIAETWHVEDWLGALFQLGALPPKS